jgi:hypothetical protein
MVETWCPVRGFTGRYSVSNLGRVRSKERRVCNRPDGRTRRVRERILKARPVKGGYLCVWLYRSNRKVHVAKVASLVADAFLGRRPEGLDVCHDNGINTDNRAANLKYGTRTQNMDDARRHGTLVRGEKQGRSKINRNQVRQIRKDERRLTDIAIAFGISFQHVSAIKRKRVWAWLK